jgi:hypothetical protein
VFGNVLGSLQELLAMFGVSTGTVVFVVVVTAVLSAAILTGQTARLGVWFEDIWHRFVASAD